MFRRPIIETLECRTLFAAVTVTGLNVGGRFVPFIVSQSVELTSRGTLVVHGTGSNDNITLSRKAGTIIVNMAPASGVTIGQTEHAADVKRILVEGNGGNDRVVVQQNVGKRATLVGGRGNDSLTGSFGDTLIGGIGNDSLVLPARHTVDDQTGDVTADVIPFGPSLLSGGEGDDELLADRDDIIVGGKGSDTAGEALSTINFMHGDTTLFRSLNIKADLEANSSGIESFGGLTITAR